MYLSFPHTPWHLQLKSHEHGPDALFCYVIVSGRTHELPTRKMDRSRYIFQAINRPSTLRNADRLSRRPISYVCTHCLRRNAVRKPTDLLRQRRRYASGQPADDPSFVSLVDQPAQLVKVRRRHNVLGLLVLAAIPVTSFILGCWQVQRLGWKTDLIARFEDRLLRDPLPLPPRIDLDAIEDFDYRRVYARGVLKHDQEMLIGPRVHDGQNGYLVITPLDRSADFPSKDNDTKILVNRGWIPKSKAAQSSRPDGIPQGEVVVQGLLRLPWKKNMFTPDNIPQEGKFYFPDVLEMAEFTGSQPVWIEETMKPDLLQAYDREDRGIPIGRPAEVNLRNNHAQCESLQYFKRRGKSILTRAQISSHGSAYVPRPA